MAEIGGDDGEGRQGVGGKLDLELQVADGRRHRPVAEKRPSPRRLAAALAQAPDRFRPHRRRIRLPSYALRRGETTLYHP
jgi:hypothetical protein